MTKSKEPSQKGFTLIELMIVVAIIGILAAIAVPKFTELIRKSGEGASKGNLGSLRAVMSIYYADLEGLYPTALASLTIGGKYITSLPVAKAPTYHVDTNAETDLTTDGTTLNIASPNDAGGWFYDNQAASANVGNMFVNCTHTDTKGTVWTAY